MVRSKASGTYPPDFTVNANRLAPLAPKFKYKVHAPLNALGISLVFSLAALYLREHNHVLSNASATAFFIPPLVVCSSCVFSPSHIDGSRHFGFPLFSYIEEYSPIRFLVQDTFFQPYLGDAFYQKLCVNQRRGRGAEGTLPDPARTCHFFKFLPKGVLEL